MTKRKQIWKKAKEAVDNTDKLHQILVQASSKLSGLKKSPEGGATELSSKVGTLIQMLKSYIRGEYRTFSGKTILLVVFALLYFVIPTDALPDFLPVLGFTDDLSVLYLVFKHIASDIEQFQEANS